MGKTNNYFMVVYYILGEANWPRAAWFPFFFDDEDEASTDRALRDARMSIEKLSVLELDSFKPVRLSVFRRLPGHPELAAMGDVGPGAELAEAN